MYKSKIYKGQYYEGFASSESATHPEMYVVYYRHHNEPYWHEIASCYWLAKIYASKETARRAAKRIAENWG